MKTLLVAFFAFLSVSVFAQKAGNEVYKFDTENFNYGQIKQNSPATATFIVTNKGNKPLIIEDARPSCGCTVGDFTKAPIAPGKTGKITAVFNAAALGPIRKTVSVKFAGDNEVKFLKLSGEVLNAKEYAKVQK